MYKMKIGIIGNGVVGHAIARTYIENYDVRVYDIDANKSTCIFEEVFNVDLIFVCIPEKELDNFCSMIGGNELFRRFANKNFVIKSTCPIGTTRRLQEQYNLPNIVHSPEFLTARVSVTDALLPSRNIIGIPNPSRYGLRTADNRAAEALNILYHTRFPGIQVQLISSDESEAIKLFTNAFFATKISFFNEINQLCKALNLDWSSILAGMLSDGRISHSHTAVPGPDGHYGFGGSCLPKDLTTLINHMMENINSSTILLEQVEQVNISNRKRRN